MCGVDDAIGKHLSILLAGTSESGKTKVWKVNALMGDVYLGKIAWFANWRQYNFIPGDCTTYAASCLRDIADFCDFQTLRQKGTHGVPKS